MDKFSYLARTNLEYIEQQFQSFKANPNSVDQDFRLFFEGIEFAKNLSANEGMSSKEISVYDLIRYYRDYGHLKAHLDPLGLKRPESSAFDLKNFGLSEADLTKTFQVGGFVNHPNAQLKTIITHLEKIYCGTLTANVSDCEPNVRKWFHDEFEKSSPTFKLTPELKKNIFYSLAKTEALEKFIHTRYVGTKRFSVEGGDSMLPMLEHIVNKGSEIGVEEVVIGMAHRGRINVLANFMDKGLDVIFSEFEGITIDLLGYDGDVKYHMGYSSTKKVGDKDFHVSLAFNPSHLEAVNPVVCGMTRAKQRVRKDTGPRKKVVPILIHGDAAVIGQGVVAETLQLSKLKGYTVGGTVHIIINNQVGFTTDPIDSRSTRYCSDIAKSISAPVLLVNGDDVEACVRAIDIAIRYRQQFGSDIMIDMICYRRFGHNEGDEPAFTQPKMYELIKKHPTPMALYQQKIAGEKVLEESAAKAFYDEKINNLQAILDSVRKKPSEVKPLQFKGLWEGLRAGSLEDFSKASVTKAKKQDVQHALKVLTEKPANFKLNPKIEKLIEARAEMVKADALDWAMGELLAYGTLRVEGTPVRLSGQDCMRGTFTHRQAVYFDSVTGESHTPLKTINTTAGEFCIYNSSLSEMAVLGFEYGNASSDPTFLTIWEAQFGDFANGAQIIIDQFLTSGEAKWGRHNGLVLLLPHGYEGQGPEHSSARMERFLQMCANANMQVCNVTTPANLFHVLRRQVKRDFRKPLIIMSPKSLLRHPKVVSPVEDFVNGQFMDVIDDKVSSPAKVETVLMCTGKVYYDLLAEREKLGANSGKTAIVRLEQIFPFPTWSLSPIVNQYKNARRWVWCQEEPKNMGAWPFLDSKLRDFAEQIGMNKLEIEYVGRTERASPAVGSNKKHNVEQAEIIKKALSYS